LFSPGLHFNAEIIFFRDYIHSVLRWIESQPDALVFVILIVLYTLVSLPIAWGYIIINIATGEESDHMR
jgi:protein maelstrom